MELDEADDGSKDLFACDAHVVRDVGDDGRLHECAAFEPRTLGACAAADDACALFLCDVDVFETVLELVRVDLRADLRRILPRETNLHRFEFLLDCREEFVINRVLHEYARSGTANLPLVKENTEADALNRLFPRRILEVDVRGFAAELERRGDQAIRRRLCDVVADLGGAGEGEFFQPFVLEDVVARRGAAPGDEVEHACGQEVFDDVREGEHAERGLARGLKYDAVARGKRGGEFPRRHEEREVPRDDLSDDAKRFAQNDRECILVDLRCGALFGADDAREVAEVIAREGNVDGARLADGLAVVKTLDVGEIFGVLIDSVGDLQQNISALGGARLLPRGERLPARLDRLIDVRLRRLGADADDLARGGRRHFVRFLALGGDPFAVDEEPPAGAIAAVFDFFCDFAQYHHSFLRILIQMFFYYSATGIPFQY